MILGKCSSQSLSHKKVTIMKETLPHFSIILPSTTKQCRRFEVLSKFGFSPILGSKKFYLHQGFQFWSMEAQLVSLELVVVFAKVDIWEERKVFGSRGKSLKDEMLGKDPPPLLENNGRSSNSIKIVKKDAHSIRLKLAVGGMPAKIVTAFQAVHDEHFNEDTALNKCKAAVRCVEKMEKDVDNGCIQGNQQGPTFANELQEQENALRQCIDQLESVEATRVALVAQLKEALQDQESKLELIRTQLQVRIMIFFYFFIE
ncbi:uncharacterized protein LOC122069002 isoform X3 [Macadamia integrifolia]|nr:uncharacterized protein LOC122069002 isoform X3 [Macadamia integrifolia]